MKYKNAKSCRSGILFSGNTLARTLALGALLAGLGSVRAGTVLKANVSDDLDLGSSWVGGVVPTNTDVATWDSTVTSANTTLLATNLGWAGLKISNPGGLVTINSTTTNANAGATLTLGASGLGLSTASQDLTFGAPVALLGDTAQSWNLGPSGRTLTLNGTLTRNARATLSLDNSAGGLMTVPSGTASTVLNYSVLDQTDFGALDASKNLTSAANVISYSPNPSGTTANSASLAGTYQWIDVVNSNPLNAPSAFRLSSTLTTSGGIRFNVPNTLGIDWVVDANSRNYNLGGAAILVTSNVGPHNVIFQDGGTGIRLATGSEVIFAQYNPYGDLMINGHISQPSGSGANVTKTGPGRVVFNNADSYNGLTDIEQGSLLVNGSVTSSLITVNNGATLGGAGRVGAVTVAPGGIIAAGSTNNVGTLTVGGTLTFNAGTSGLNFYGPALPTTNTTALLNLTNNLVVNGTINVSILSGAVAAGQYPLVKLTNALSGATFAAFNLAFLPPHAGGYLSNNVGNASLDLVITNVNEPLKWATGSGTWDINTSANWKDSTGTTTTYQQFGSIADSVVFEDTLSGGSPITVTLNANVVPPSTTVNASKTYTISGTGSIGGVGALTKQGSGTLTLGTANSFSGGLNVNGGTIVFSSLTNLGGGNINFGGGALQYTSGNGDDLSTRTVTFGAGGGTINDGGNSLYLANPIGNNGAGSFTKSGSGNLTLNSTNRYSGNTVVSQGTLTLGGGASISNSAAIIVNSGATFDVTQNGLITLSTPAAQALFGTGTVNGGVTVPTGTTISPATNGVAGTLNVTSGDVTFSGGTYVCDLSQSSHDLLNISGNLYLTSGTLQLNVTGTLANGTYKLIQYSAGLGSGAGSAGNLTITGFSQFGKAATLSDAVNGEIDLVIADTASDNLTWTGNAGGTWDATGSLNWLNGLNAWAFTNGDVVTFDDTAGNGYVSLQTAVKPGSVTVNNNSVSYMFADGTFTGAGKLSGSASLTKNGSGTLIIDTLNDNTGPVTINTGTLQVGDGSSTGNIGAGNITNNASLVFMQTDSRSVNGTISGTGALTQSGTSTLTLAQNNTYTGPTTINSGTLQVGTGTGVGSVGPAAITNNGTLLYNRSGTFTVNNGITGTGGVTFNGTATVTLAGANDYTGTTSVGAGTTVKLAASGVIPATGNGNNNVNVTGKLDLNGFNQTVSRLNGSGTIVDDAGSATNVLTINYDGTGTADSSVVIADNDGTGGKVALLKIGTGSQIVRGTSTFTGGTIVSNGTLNVRANSALSTGPVILRGGNLSFASITFANAIQADTNATLDTPGNGTVTLTGPITTASNLTVFIDNNETWTWNGGAAQLAGVTGTISITGPQGFFRFGNSQGSASATFDMTGSSITMNSQNSSGSYQLGALVGDSTPFIGGANNSTFIIGGKNIDSTFAGTFNSTSNNLVKTGTGTFTMSGSYGFTGTTTVSNGVLALAGSVTLDSSSSIAVRNGGKLDVSGINAGILNIGNIANQTLTGAGTVLGSVTATGAGVATINPGDTIGTLTITNALTLAANSMLTMELNRTNAGATNDMIVAQSLAPNGTLNVTNVGPNLMNGDTFKLFNQPVSGFTTIVLPSTDASGTSTYTWKTNLNVDGSIQLVSGGASPVNTAPTNLVFQASGGQLTLSWPADHTGWRLQSQTNSLTGTWSDVAGANSTNQITIPVGSTNGSVFFRMIYP